MVAYHPRRYVSSWLIAKAMPPYETYAAPGGQRLTVWRAERRSSLAGSRLGRAPPQSTSSFVAMVGTACTPVPKASSHKERGAEIRSGSHAVSAASSPRPAARATPRKPPHPPGRTPRRTRRGAPPRGAPGRVPVLRRRSGGPGQAWSGAGTGTVDLGPVVLGELGRARRRGRASDRGCTSGAARAAPPGQHRRGRPELEGEPLDLHQPLVLGLLDLGAEDIAVGSQDQSKTSDPQYFLS